MKVKGCLQSLWPTVLSTISCPLNPDVPSLLSLSSFPICLEGSAKAAPPLPPLYQVFSPTWRRSGSLPALPRKATSMCWRRRAKDGKRDGWSSVGLMSSSSETRGRTKIEVLQCIKPPCRDPCERALINLATARTEYSPGEAAAGVSHSFSIVTYQRGYLIQVKNCRSSKIAKAWLFQFCRRPATETSTTGFTPSTHSLPVRSSQR